MTMRSVPALILFIVVVYAAAGIGSLFTAQSVNDWYVALSKPSWNPPSWVFGPVWTVLYGMMGVAAWLVWLRRREVSVTLPLVLFFVQLALNVVWSLLFFGLQSPGAAFLEIIVLWLAIAATLLAFWRVAPLAGALFIPYILWVSFAAVLNYTIWQLNAG